MAIPRGRAYEVDLTGMGLSGVKVKMDKLMDSSVNESQEAGG